MAEQKQKNKMREIVIDKLTLNIGTGANQDKLVKAMKLLKNITGIDPIKTHSKKRIATWNIRPGLPIGTKITLRGKKAVETIPRLLVAKEKKLKESCFDNNGNVSFGIPEYIEIENLEYDPEIKMMGLQASITLRRKGFRINKRKLHTKKIPDKERINKEEAIEFIQKKFNIKVEK